MADETNNNPTNQTPSFDEFLAQSDFLNPASVDQQLAPKVNWQDNFVNPTYLIKDNTSGVSPNVTPSDVKSQVNPAHFEAIAQQLQLGYDYGESDRSQYAEPYAYDASPKGTFRERYKAYGQDTFNKVGFHPLIDNETLFNHNTTFGDDIKRWATHSLWPMFSKGVMDPIKSYKSVMEGKGLFYADEQSARDYQYYNAIGQSTKGGLGGFTVNLLNSASYSMGILTEGAIEGFMIGGLFGGPAGAAAGATSFLRKLANLPKGFANLAKGTTKLFDDLAKYSNISEAKKYWTAAGKNFGNFVNPLENTTRAMALSNTNNLDNLARSSATAGALWHDIMAMNLALSEGKLEGGFTRYETYDRLYNDFLKDPANKGKTPTLEQQEAMMRQASKASWWNTLNNTALIYYTNKLVFPSITRASFLRGVPRFTSGKVITNVGKEYQVLFEPGKKSLEGQFIKQRVNIVNALKSLGKPATYGRMGLNYFKANVMEGVQEVSQDILQEATQNYYVETFKNSDARNFRYASGLVGDAIDKQWSAQGLEVFLSGFLMGSILQAPGKIKNYATIGYNDYFNNTEKYQDYIKNRESLADDIVKEMNTLYKNSNYFFDPRINSYAQQALSSKVIDNPEEHTNKEIADAEFATFYTALMSSLQRGTFDMFLKHYENYRQASPQDIEEAWNLEPGQGEEALKKFDDALKNARQISNRHNFVKKEMQQFRLNLDDFEKDTEEYRIAEVYNNAFDLAVNNAVFFHASFDKNTETIKKLYNNISKITALAEVPLVDVTALTDPGKLMREIEMLKTEIESLETVTTEEATAEVARKRERLELLTRYNQGLEDVVDAFLDKERLKLITEIIKEQDSEITDEAAELKAIQQLINQIEEGETNKFLDFKDVFKSLLIGLSPSNEKRLEIENQIETLGGMDDLFDNLLDTFVLRNENARLNEYVNLLSSPNGFYEHVVKNFQFMKDLYNNREEIVKEIVNQEISAIEKNSLLNALADRGIFVDLEDFGNWLENPNNLPESFIDVTNNRIIDKGSLLYQEYIDIFQKAIMLDEQKPAGEKLSPKEVLDKKIQELEDERARLIGEERKKFDQKFLEKYGMTLEEYKTQEAQRVDVNELSQEERAALESEKKLLTKALETLQSEDHTTVIATAAAIAENSLAKLGINDEEWFTNQTDKYARDVELNKIIVGLVPRFNSEDYNENVEAALKSQVYSEFAKERLNEIEIELEKKEAGIQIDVENTPEYLQLQEAIDAINAKYDKLIEDLKAEFERSGADVNAPTQYSTQTKFEDFDQEYQSEITKLFDEYLVDTLQELLELKNNDPIQYERLRSNWLETQSNLIKDFNERNKQKALDKVERLSKPPVLKFIPTLKVGADTTTYALSSVIRRLQKFLEDGQYPNPKDSAKMIQLKPEDIQNIKDDIEALNGYLNARVEAAGPRNIAEETINIIVDNVIDKQDELEILYNEDGEVIGRTFKDRNPEDPMPDRATQVAEEVENAILGTEPYKYHAIKEPVDKETGERKPSPLENLYNQFFNEEVAPEDRIRLFMEDFRRRAVTNWKAFNFEEKLQAVENILKTDGSYEALRDVVAKYASKESADAGNVVDDLIRIFLTPNANTKSGFSEFNYDSEIEIKGKMTKISDTMSKKAFDKLFAPVSMTSPGGIVTKFRLGIVDGSYTILSENVKLFDRSFRDGKGVTGEVDLILVKEDGSVAIVDIKTKKGSWKGFGNPDENKYEKSTYFRAQQSIYGYMFHNNTGITPELKLMPFGITLSDTKVGYIEDITLADIVPDGQDTIDLEYLPEIENHGIAKVTPTNVKVRTKTESTGKTKLGIEESDPTKITLEDNLGKPVIYNGRAGKLVRMADGNFGVEVVGSYKGIKVSDNLTNLQLTLDALKANLEVERGEFGNEDYIKAIEDEIAKLTKAIESQETIVEVFPIQNVGISIGNGKMRLDQVGLSLVIPTESVGQVSTINGEVVNAAFSNKEETIATINGVRYDVLRDKTGQITALTYMSNSQEISELDKQIGNNTNKIGNLRSTLAETVDENTRNSIISRISKIQLELDSLRRKRSSLIKSNQKVYIYGNNANNYIFALNRLPNNFQKATRNANRLDEVRDLKLIDQLSFSESISQAITGILSEQYPEALDRLIEGDVKSVNSKDLLNIQLWIEDAVQKLNDLGFSVFNKGDLVDDITNQIHALNELSNDLELIKLTKDGKIYNYKQVAKRFTEGQQVQDGAVVSADEGVRRGPTETVSRPATREELEDLVKQARKKDELGFSDTFTEDTAAIAKIQQATVDNITKIYEQLALEAIQNGQDYSKLEKAYNERLTKLKTIVSKDSISKGEFLISKNPIFTDQAGEIVEVVRVNNKSIRVKHLQTLQEETFNDNEFMENFEKTTEEATQPTPETTIDALDVQGSQESKDVIRNLTNDAAATDQAKSNSKESDAQSRWDKLGNNSKLC